MDPIIDEGGGKRNGSKKGNENKNTDSVRSKKTSAFYFAGGPLSSRVNYGSLSKAKVRKSKSDHGGTNLSGLEPSKLYTDDTTDNKPRSTNGSDGSKPTRNTNIGQSHSFNYHLNRQSKKSAVGMGLANINQQLLSATMFGVVLGGDTKASQQVLRKTSILSSVKSILFFQDIQYNSNT